MLTKKDIVIIGDLIRDNNVLIKGFIDQSATDTKREIRDEMHSVVNAAVAGSEARMMKELHDFRREVTDLIGEQILPQFDEIREDIVEIKEFIKMPIKNELRVAR